MQNNTPRKLSQVLEEAINSLEGDKISFKLLIEQLGSRAYGILLVLLTLPNAIPISGVLGISTLTGLLMLIFSVQMAFAIEKPWLPKFIAEKGISKELLLKALKVVSPYLKKIEPFIKPRMTMLNTPTALRVIGWIIVAFCIAILIPIPFSNFGPALAIFLIGLGMLEKDGVFALIGVILGLIYCSALFWFLFEIISKIFASF